MGRVKTRTLNDGRIRHTAYYFDGETERSARTYTQARDAQRAWRRCERELEHDRRERRSAGKRTLAGYVQTWFPAHPCEPSTRQSYAFWLERYVLPVFGHHRLARLTPAQVRTALARLAKAGASRDILEAVRYVLGAIYTTAVTDQILTHHPCHGVKLPRNVRPRLAILSPDTNSNSSWTTSKTRSPP